VLVALVGLKATRSAIHRLRHPRPKAHAALPAAAPLAPRKPVGPLHFIAGHPRIVLTGSRVARMKAALATPEGKRFTEMVEDKMAGGDVYAFTGDHAAFLYGLTRDKKYGKFAVSYVDQFVAEEEKKIAKGEAPEVAADSYLHVGWKVGAVMLTYDWCYDLLSESQKKRWLAYADQAVWNVWHHTEATWGGKRHEWSGWATDYPTNNYFSSFLEATMVLGLVARGEHPRAEQWVKEFREKHIGDELMPLYERDLKGGGSREGTGYGIEMRRLFRLYDWWESATGENIADLTSQTKDSLIWMIHTTVPTLDFLVTIGDQARESTAGLFDFHREYVEVLTSLYRRDPWAGFGQWYLSHCAVKRMTQPFTRIYDVAYLERDVPERPLDQLYPVYYAPGPGHLFARSSWRPDATWLGVLAGPLTESHSHRDLGSFQIYKNEWLAYDAGFDSHSGLRQEEAAHNLVELTKGGKPVTMRYGNSARLVALEDDPAFLYVAVDVTPMYAERAGVSSVQREMVFIKPDTFVVFDRVSAKADITKTWHLSTPHKPVAKSNFASIQGKKSNLTVTALLPRGANPKVVNWPSVDKDYGAGYRVDVAGAPAETTQFLTVLSVDGAVTKVSEGAPNPAGPGAEVGLKDGRTVRVNFASTDWGGALEIAVGSRSMKRPLKAAIAQLPVLAPTAAK
jgi:hypothetical protein